MTPRETENNAYAKFWGEKQRALWCVMVFSGVISRLNVMYNVLKATSHDFRNLQIGGPYE